MNFAQNLIYIRQHYGVTQEALAEQLGVSRQTVSKWEADINYPETDKLLALCDLYHTNLDDLMRGSVKIANVKDTELYDAHMNRFCWGVVAGNTVILCGVGVMLFLTGLAVVANISAAVMLSFIVVGALILVVSGLNHHEFKRKNANIEPSYPSDVLDRFGKRFTVLVASGIGVIMLSIILLVALSPGDGEIVALNEVSFSYLLVVAVFMLFLALGVGLIIYAALQKSKYDKTEFTYIVADGSSSQGRGGTGSLRISPEEMKRAQAMGAIYGTIMLVATIVFFVLGFSVGSFPFEGSWQESGFAYSWIAFPVGGILCAIVALFAGVFSQTNEEVVAGAKKGNPWVKVDKGDGEEYLRETKGAGSSRGNRRR